MAVSGGGENFSLSLLMPGEMFAQLAEVRVSAVSVLFRYVIWLLLLPPLFLFVGGYLFGWDVGGREPLQLSVWGLLWASVGYFLALLFGFVSTCLLSRWMAGTYGGSVDLGLHFMLVAVVGSPLVVASLMHLLPVLVFNILVFLPALLWCLYLLYTGLPVALGMSAERGMLMASALVGWLLVAAVSLLGGVLVFWSLGIGPLLGV